MKQNIPTEVAVNERPIQRRFCGAHQPGVDTIGVDRALRRHMDHRCHAFRRLGGLPALAGVGGGEHVTAGRAGVDAGRLTAVAGVVAVQLVVLGAIAAALGWAPAGAGLGWGLLLVVLGCTAFGSLGILLGGTVRASESVTVNAAPQSQPPSGVGGGGGSFGVIALLFLAVATWAKHQLDPTKGTPSKGGSES